MCMVDFDGHWEFLNVKTQKARKEHICNECWRTIKPGEEYEYSFGRFDGEAQEHKTCTHCQVPTAWLAQECGGSLYEMVLEDIEDHLKGGSFRYDLARLAVGMRRKWKRFTGNGLMPIPALPKLTP